MSTQLWGLEGIKQDGSDAKNMADGARTMAVRLDVAWWAFPPPPSP